MRAPAQSLGRLFLRFLRFGALAWGGPVAQIDMIRQELVAEEKWISPRYFKRLLAIYFDLTAMPPPDQLRAFKAAKTFVRAQMTAADLVAIMAFTSGDLTAAALAALGRSRRLALVLLRVKIELLFALGAAEVIRLPFVLGSSSCGSRFYVHTAHRIFHSCCAFHYHLSSVCEYWANDRSNVD